MSKHTAEQSVASRIREHRAWAISTQTGTVKPGFGKHRATEES